LATIWLNTADTEPASHSSTANCGDGTSLSCSLYAYGWDTYGNSLPSEGTKDDFSCTEWQFLNNTAPAAPTGFATSGHSSNVTQNTYHIAGDLRCTVGGVSNSTALSGKIQKNYGLACSRTCTGNDIATVSCDVTNSTGYSATFALTPSAGSAGEATGNCTTGAGNCTGIAITGFGTTQSLTVNVAATEGNSSVVNLIDPAAPAATLTCPEL
jgi:hypothetical protein